MADQRPTQGLTPDPEGSGLIVLDYPGPQARSRIKSIAAKVWGNDARYLLDEIRPRELSLRAYAAILAERLGDTRPPRAVAAYCAAAEIARELEAAYFERAGQHLKLCLVNPTTPSLEEAIWVAQEIVRTAGGTPGPEITHVSVGWLERFDSTLAQCYETQLGLSSADSDVLAELVEMQSEWVAYLLAASQGAAAPRHAEEVHVLSNDHTCPSECGAAHISIDAAQQHLFESHHFLSVMLEHTARPALPEPSSLTGSVAGRSSD